QFESMSSTFGRLKKPELNSVAEEKLFFRCAVRWVVSRTVRDAVESIVAAGPSAAVQPGQAQQRWCPRLRRAADQLAQPLDRPAVQLARPDSRPLQPELRLLRAAHSNSASCRPAPPRTASCPAR